MPVTSVRGHKSTLNMAEKEKRKRGGRRCVAGVPQKISCSNDSHTPGITMHKFPIDPKVRAVWVRFVQRHRSDFHEPVSKHACLCSAHFEESCFTKIQHKDTAHLKLRRFLVTDSIPTRHTVLPPGPQVLTDRRKRKLERSLSSEGTAKKRSKKRSSSLLAASTPSTCTATSTEPSTPSTCTSTSTEPSTPSTCTATSTEPSTPSTCTATSTEPSTPSTFTATFTEPSEPATFSDPDVMESSSCTPPATPTSSLSRATSTPASGCTKCAENEKAMRNLKKSNQRQKRRVKELQQAIKELRVVESDGESEQEQVQASPNDCPQSHEELAAEDQEDHESDLEVPEENEDDVRVDYTYASMEESTESDSNADEDLEEHADNITVDPGLPEYKQPKFIVFYWKLMSLFTMFCFHCKEAGPTATVKSLGTMVSITQHCLKCRQTYDWQSQPLTREKLPVGNLLLSFAILMAGASVSKTLLIFRHMGLSVFAARTYFRHQRSFIFPIVLHYWELYRANLASKLKSMKDVVWTGDGRFDSMGHSAKYGAYTMLCTTIMKIVHFEIVQANETGGSQQTELEGCKRCFAFLKELGLTVAVFISDRHRGIAKWIRESCVDTRHFFDIWHVARSITKKLLKASKEKGCETIASWMKGIRKHLYWCATSTKAGFGALIVAKWNSFMRHVANKHTNHPDMLYKECNHGELEQRKWIKIGTAAYQKLHGLLTNKTLVNDIKKLSSDAQTSCLEGFHATLNHWHPKMICFSWLGTVCRHILASLHFNENVQRATQIGKEGSVCVKVCFPKYKLGEEVVRDVRSPSTYDYVDEMKKLLFSLPRAAMKETFTRYSSKAPGSLTSQFPDRTSKAEAMKAYNRRQQQKNSTLLFPSGEDQNVLEETAEENQPSNPNARRASRHCRTCKQPMRGHTREKCQQYANGS